MAEHGDELFTQLGQVAFLAQLGLGVLQVLFGLDLNDSRRAKKIPRCSGGCWT